MSEIDGAILELRRLQTQHKLRQDIGLANTYNNLELAIKALTEKLEREQGWIPVRERLPTKEEYNENSGRFIVTDSNRVYQLLFDIYDKNQFVNITYLGNCNFNESVDERVIAWMVLPKPYKEVTK